MKHYTNYKVLYVSGPMSGYKDFNYPRFNREASRLRALGYTVVNPAETTVKADKQWSDYMREAITKLMKADVVVVLENWEYSTGANTEVDLARKLQMPVYDWFTIDQPYRDLVTEIEQEQNNNKDLVYETAN